MGCIAGKYFINPLFASTLSTVGIVKTSLILNMDLFLGTFIFITVFAFIISIICAYKVRKIELYKMITE